MPNEARTETSSRARNADQRPGSGERTQVLPIQLVPHSSAPRSGEARVAESPALGTQPRPENDKSERWDRVLELIGTFAVFASFFGLALFAS
jgi:hypothetical protein